MGDVVGLYYVYLLDYPDEEESVIKWSDSSDLRTIQVYRCIQSLQTYNILTAEREGWRQNGYCDH